MGYMYSCKIIFKETPAASNPFIARNVPRECCATIAANGVPGYTVIMMKISPFSSEDASLELAQWTSAEFMWDALTNGAL